MIQYDKIFTTEPLLGEEWRNVSGWEDLYMISNFGRVKSKNRKCKHPRNANKIHVKKEKVLKQHNGRGYNTVLLYRNEWDKYRTGVHRLMAIEFISNPEKKPTVNHIDGIKTHNVLSNLEWATEREQQNHAVSIGVRNNTLGENCNLSKLKEEDVLLIREMYKTGLYLQKEIGEKFGIREETCSNIIRRKSWKHI